MSISTLEEQFSAIFIDPFHFGDLWKSQVSMYTVFDYLYTL